MTLHFFLDQLNTFGFIFFALMTFGQLLVKRKSTRHLFLMVFFISLAMALLANLNTNSADLSYKYSWLVLIDLPFLYAIGPVLFLYEQDVHKPLRGWGFLKHFIPAVIAAIICIPFYIDDPAVKGQILASSFNKDVFVPGELDFYGYMYFAGFCSVFAYFVAFARGVRPMLDLKVIRQDNTAQVLVLLFVFTIVTVAFFAAGLLSTSFLMLKFATSTISIGAVTFFVLGHRYPDLYNDLVQAIEQTKYQSSHLENVNLKNLESMLTKLMDEEKLYLDEKISLSKLARLCNLNQSQLSQYLNQYKRQNFNQYINGFRIEDAKKRISSSSDSILSIAYAVGFNSISTFNTSFKKQVGVTPTKYRKRK